MDKTVSMAPYIIIGNVVVFGVTIGGSFIGGLLMLAGIEVSAAILVLVIFILPIILDLILTAHYFMKVRAQFGLPIFLRVAAVFLSSWSLLVLAISAINLFSSFHR